MHPVASRRPLAARLRPRAAVALVAAALCLGGGPAAVGDEPPPSDALLKLTPSDVGLILTIDHLRERSREIVDSQLFGDLQRLPAFQTWLDSETVRNFLQSRDQIEQFLQATFGEIRDDVFGDALVLALRLPPDRAADPSEARGVLITRARDPKLLRRLVKLVNSTQQRNGEIAELIERRHGETVYHTRGYAPGDPHLPESFVIFDDGTFAFSNAEGLIHEVIDRRAKPGSTPSAADHPGFRAMSARLSSQAVARLFLDPRSASRLLGGLPAPTTPDDRNVGAMIERYVGALDYVGAALVVRGREVRLQAVQAFQPDKIRELAGPWFAEPETNRPGSRLLAVPGSAVAVASLNVDFPSLYRLLLGLVPDADQLRVRKIETIADGLLLGLGFRRQVLPALGPRVVAYVEPPEFSEGRSEALPRSFPFPVVVAAEINEETGRDVRVEGSREVRSSAVSDALENALHTILAAISLDEKRVPAAAHVDVHDVGGIGVRTLSTPFPFGFAVDRPGRRVVLGDSADAVTRYLEAGADAEAGRRFKTIRAAAFPDCDSYVCVDLAAVHRLALQHRDRLIDVTARDERRPAADVGRDLDQVLGFVQLFDAAFLSARVDVKNATLEHAIGLLPRPASTSPSPSR